MKKREELIGVDNAKEQIELFLNWYGMETEDVFASDASGKDTQAGTRSAVHDRLVKRIRQGYIEIKLADVKGVETIHLVQSLDYAIDGKNEVLYPELTGRIRASVKAEAGDNDTEQAYKFLGALSTEGPSFFYKLKGADMGVADLVWLLFLVV
jgi:hypothetical protein